MSQVAWSVGFVAEVHILDTCPLVGGIVGEGLEGIGRDVSWESGFKVLKVHVIPS